jgi:hypothetical protein
MDTQTINTLITVLGGGLLTIAGLLIKQVADNSKRAKLDAKIRDLRIQGDELRAKRDESYDDYDMASKDLTLSHAQSYVTGNDRNKLVGDIAGMEAAKAAFKEANKDYYRNLKSLNAQMRGA